MKTTGQGVELELRSARRLHQKILNSGEAGGCLPISIRALGGEISVRKATSGDEALTRLSLVEESQLDLGALIEIETEVTSTYLEDVFELLMQYSEDGWGQLKGLLVLYYFSNVGDLSNHYFVILPREQFSPRVQKSLEKRKQYKVVDSAGGRLIGKTSTKDFAEFFNQIIDLRGTFLIFQVFKR